MVPFLCLLPAYFVLVLGAGERINHVGRILPPIPSVTSSLLGQTSQADAVLQSLQIFPPQNSWNEDVSKLPTDPTSASVMNKIYTDLYQASFRKLRFNYDMAYAIVPSNQPTVSVSFYNYPDDSDPSPYPIPSNMPIEGWPLGLLYGGQNETLQQYQGDCSGDCHAMFLNPNGGLWEIYTAQYVTGTGWQGSNGAFFNYSKDFFRGQTGSTCCNKQGVSWSTSVSNGFTSADASGLSVFAGTVRYDETERGQIEHSIRCQMRCGTGPVYPATHKANQYQKSSSHPCGTSQYDAKLGMRFRLKNSYVIPSTWSAESQTLARALKQFGCILTDWASFWSISVSPDIRWNQAVPAGSGPGPFDDIMSLGSGPGLQITDMELVTTNLTSGPRSSGAPTLIAGPDQAISQWTATLSATVTTTKSATLTWYTYVDRVPSQLYASAGVATFGSPTTTISTAVTNRVYTTSVTFPKNGRYYLMSQLNDQVHAPVFDVVIVNVAKP